MTVTGTYQPASGQPAPASVVMTFSVYAESTGGAAVWQETQDVTLDRTGRYVVQLGATRPDGLPVAVFADNEERWLGVQIADEAERPRTRLTSVPYALRAADTETLGGHPASAYVLAPTASGSGSSPSASSNASTGNASTQPPANIVQNGTINTLAKYVNSTDVGNSAVTEVNGQVGVGTSVPLDFMHVRYTNTNGQFTGFAVQNLGNTPTSYSGMLFYDQNGALGQFQGYNNITHEYRINNIARNGASLFDGSINFMIGGTSRFFVSPVTVGIGTTLPSPTANLDVSNAISGSGNTTVNVTTYSANAFGPALTGKKARGTQAAPTSVLNNDALLDLSANGYGATGFAGLNSANISMRASENWTDTAQGSIMNFSTTASGTTGPVTRMTIGPTGNVGIGTFFTPAGLEVSNANGVAGAGMIFSTTFTNAGTTLFVGRRARGTGIAPTAVLSGDNLVGYLAQGFGTSGFSGTRGGMFVQAAENWTDLAQGTRLFFNTTDTGTNTPSTKMTVDPSGNVGIGTPVPGGALEVKRTGTDAVILNTVYTNGIGNNNANPLFGTRFANGTPAAPSAAQTGDVLGAWVATGYGATQFGSVTGGMSVIAQENWTDTAQGSATGLLATPVGTTTPHLYMAVLPSGNVGIGDWALPTPSPTATDKLQVFGDVRVGTSGTNGCVMNFAGTGLIGTCASDRRYKKGITPFGPALDRVAALQPVHFYWRADEFPQHHFGESQAYGLIAQEVEQVLPELVVTHEDGYKAVDYSKLPLLTIQAVKELKAENDDLKKKVDEIDELKKRISDLERSLIELQRRPSDQR
jgi:hypothetical protein